MTFSSMYIAATGMIAMGTGMQTISNNLANVETNGFKTMRTNYSDLISKDHFTTAPWPQQVGRGVRVQSIQSMFTQGAFKKTESPLDLALAGDGFFNVRSRISYHLPQSEEIMYTRAGAYTLDRNGYMEDQSGNILQGWAMSLPRPGEAPVRLGSPVDIQITAWTMPPRATTVMRQVINLNADAPTAYHYPAYGLAEKYAKEQAELAGQAARGPAEMAVWNTAVDTQVSESSILPGALSASNSYDFNRFFIERYNEMFAPESSPLPVGDPASAAITIESIRLVTEPDRFKGEMTQAEFSILTALALADMEKLAANAGRTAHATAFNATYDAVYGRYSTGTPAASQWQWEGHGYAGAWDGRLSPPIAVNNYSHYETQITYDADGRPHVLTTYYQKNPHEANVWDYIVTCDPAEDGRLDSRGQPVAGTAMAGLLQKGKITFDANGKIKDMEAQDMNSAASRAAYTDPPVSLAGPNQVTIGGNYTGPGRINPATGTVVSAPRTYTISYTANNDMNPPTLGFTWTDDLGITGFVPVETKYILPGHEPPVEWESEGLPPSSAYIPVITYPGPYTLGNDGLTLTFNHDPNAPPQPFGAPGQDFARVTAHSEQFGWTADAPNANGYLTVNAQFRNAPAAQSIDLDMGARWTGGAWRPGDPSTTLYGGRSMTVDSRQDGYPQGSLSQFFVTEDGLITGIYSNKQERALYQICITRFLNPWGLMKMGNNLFAVTRHSGPGVTTGPIENGAATILSSFLEQSNVDTATEIVNMIMTQRGFQANAKVVTTHDAMISTAIETKR